MNKQTKGIEVICKNIEVILKIFSSYCVVSTFLQISLLTLIVVCELL